ncbi:MAG: hypothetical protein IH845_01720 [Nanoarchaeota archaeon]|nr:hypothetical protein [Nanoarchaeota archaeon]
MENSKNILIWVAVLILILSLLYFVFSTGAFTGNVVEGKEEVIKTGEVIPGVFGISSPSEGRVYGCSRTG